MSLATRTSSRASILVTDTSAACHHTPRSTLWLYRSAIGSNKSRISNPTAVLLSIERAVERDSQQCRVAGESIGIKSNNCAGERESSWPAIEPRSCSDRSTDSRSLSLGGTRYSTDHSALHCQSAAGRTDSCRVCWFVTASEMFECEWGSSTQRSDSGNNTGRTRISSGRSSWFESTIEPRRVTCSCWWSSSCTRTSQYTDNQENSLTLTLTLTRTVTEK